MNKKMNKYPLFIKQNKKLPLPSLQMSHSFTIARPNNNMAAYKFQGINAFSDI